MFWSQDGRFPSPLQNTTTKVSEANDLCHWPRIMLADVTPHLTFVDVEQSFDTLAQFCKLETFVI
jgi:hypothetical protein